MGVLPATGNLDQARGPQDRQVPRNCGLRLGKQVHNIADAKFAGGENVENANSGRIGEGGEESVELIDSRPQNGQALGSKDGNCHIRNIEYEAESQTRKGGKQACSIRLGTVPCHSDL